MQYRVVLLSYVFPSLLTKHLKKTWRISRYVYDTADLISSGNRIYSKASYLISQDENKSSWPKCEVDSAINSLLITTSSQIPSVAAVTRYHVADTRALPSWLRRHSRHATTHSCVNLPFTFCSGWLVAGWLVFNDIFSSTNGLYHMGVWNVLCRAEDKHAGKQLTKPRRHKSALRPALCGDNLLHTNRHPQTSLSIANHLAGTEN